jgi:hypothetical protein
MNVLFASRFVLTETWAWLMIKKMHPTSHSIFALAFSYTSYKKIGHFVIPTSRSWEAAITQLVQRYAGRS